MAGISLALLVVLCLSPSLFGDRVSEAVGGRAAPPPGGRWLAPRAVLGPRRCGARGWRAALPA
ncbi:MAG: hypothetical protein LH654_13395, partial [Thermoleophilia bacterium]|nr:hypothetical protein [Thermoleophilia bacterium]